MQIESAAAIGLMAGLVAAIYRMEQLRTAESGLAVGSIG
jgi:hypothetical protein